MRHNFRTFILWSAATLANSWGISSYATELNIGYQTIPDPSQVAQVEGAYEKATQASLHWRKFDGGAEVIAAVASGAVQIAYLGSSPYTTAVSRRLPIETLLIASKLGASEALVARNGSGINTPQDLVGKKIATPFASTSHYSLLAALKLWHINPKDVTIINLSPAGIGAAWQRGDIDATYSWDPALGIAKANGKVLITSGELASQGAPTFDVWLVRKDFAKQHPDIVAGFSRVTQDAYDHYDQNPQAWIADSSNIEKLARVTGAKPSDITSVLQGNTYLSAREQREALGMPTINAIADTALFLKEQGRIESVLNDYSPYVTSIHVPQ